MKNANRGIKLVEPQVLQQETSVFQYDVAACANIILCASGGRSEQRIALQKKIVTIGRGAEADVVLSSLSVSTTHAEIVREGASYVLRDTGSRNGVLHHGQLIEELVLADGDEFSICGHTLRYAAAPKDSHDDIFEQDDVTQVGPIDASDASSGRDSSGAGRKAGRPSVKLVLSLAVVVVAGVLAFPSVDSVAVSATVIRKEPLKQTTILSGKLVPKNEVRVFASVSAPVSKIIATEGQRVEKGDPILALDPKILAMAFAKSKAEVAASISAVRAASAAMRSAERKQREDRSLARKGILSRAEVEHSAGLLNARRADHSTAVAKLRLAETAKAQAKRDHDDTLVRAPIAGQVTTINIKVGEAPRDLRGLPVATIEDASELLAEVSAGEAKIGLLRAGQPATIRLSGTGLGQELTGHVVQIAPRAEAPAHAAAATRYTAKVTVDQKHKILRAGMQVQVRVTTAEKAAAIVVPITAVVTGGRSGRGTSEQVAVVDTATMTAHWHSVETDLIGVDKVELVSGPPVGSLVIAGPVDLLLKLKDGDAVAIQDD